MTTPDPLDTDTAISSSLTRRLVLTLIALVAYRLGLTVPLPSLSPGALEVISNDPLYPVERASLFALGLAPFITGYLLVEVASLILPQGRELRASGYSGRDRLNQWSVRLSLGIGVLQAGGIAMSLQSASPAGLPLLHPGLAPRLFTILTLVAGSAAVYGLCRWINRRGFGNGFCVILLLDYLWDLKDLTLGDTQWPSPLWSTLPWQAVHLIAAAVGFGVFALWLSRTPTFTVISPAPDPETEFAPETSDAPDAEKAAAEDRAVTQNLPALPQGLVPMIWALSLISAVPMIQGLRGGSLPSATAYLASLILLLPLFSALSVKLFCTRPRLESRLNGTVDPDYEDLLRSQWIRATLMLTFITLAIAGISLHSLWSPLLDIVVLAMVAAIALDLLAEWQFRRQFPTGQRLPDLDNVHLANQLQAHLRQREIPHFAQALHYRSLFFFFQPLYKIAFWVPPEHLDQAKETLDDLNPSVI